MKKLLMLVIAGMILMMTGSVFGQRSSRKSRTPSKRPTNVQKPPTRTPPIIVPPGNGTTKGPVKPCPDGYLIITLEDCVKRTSKQPSGTTVNQAGTQPAGTTGNQKPKTRRRPTKINTPQRPR